MKVAIPSLVRNATLSSEVAECPILAASIVVFDTVTGNWEVIPVDHPPNVEICKNVDQLEKLGVQGFVSGICCKDHFKSFKEHNITVYRCTSSKIRDMVQAFELGGAFIRRFGDDMDHSLQTELRPA